MNTEYYRSTRSHFHALDWTQLHHPKARGGRWMKQFGRDKETKEPRSKSIFSFHSPCYSVAFFYKRHKGWNESNDIYGSTRSKVLYFWIRDLAITDKALPSLIYIIECLFSTSSKALHVWVFSLRTLGALNPLCVVQTLITITIFWGFAAIRHYLLRWSIRAKMCM